MAPTEAEMAYNQHVKCLFKDHETRYKAVTKTEHIEGHPDYTDYLDWTADNCRENFNIFLEKAYLADQSRFHISDYFRLKAEYGPKKLHSVAAFTGSHKLYRGRPTNPWTGANMPSYRRWKKMNTTKAHELANILGTFIELVPVGCPIPSLIIQCYGAAQAKGLRDLIAVPNGLQPLAILTKPAPLTVDASEEPSATPDELEPGTLKHNTTRNVATQTEETK